MMALRIALQTHGIGLSEAEERRIGRQLLGLERRLVNRPDPEVVVALKAYPDRRQFEADVRVSLGPLGRHLISRRTAETAARAVRLAVAAIERQLKAQHARQAGEPTFGVPSRRLPKQLRPHPPAAAAGLPEEPRSER
jgi:ribosome-associated translation inhibitor RaiA